jgi:endonuclease VIII-like 1
MPELAELRLTADYINQEAQNRVFTSVKKNPVHKGKEVEIPFNGFTISAESRGKELMLTLTQYNSQHQVKLLMTMGMSGHFNWVETGVISKHSHLRFQSADGSLDFVDVRRFGKWKLVEDWSDNRGPDPTQQFQDFVRNVKANLHKKDFDKPICEVLMNQKWFNGIGNYLRAEILYRMDINPFMTAREALTKHTNIFSLCRTIPETAYLLGGGELKDWKNPFIFETVEDVKQGWKEFMLCYGNPAMATMIDNNGKGRRFWYHPKWKDVHEETWCHYSGMPSPKAYETKEN